MDDYDADSSRGSTPRLPRIDTGYDTPGSDYMSAFRNNPRQSSFVNSDIDQDIKTLGPSSLSSISKSQTNSAQFSKDGNSKPCSRKHSRPSTQGQNRKTSVPREITIPAVNGSKNVCPKKSSTDLGLGTYGNPLKLRLSGSAKSQEKVVSAKSLSDTGTCRRPWFPPKVSKERYEEARARIMDGGKFRSRLITYFREDVPWWETKSDSEDDGYDTDLDKQLGTVCMLLEHSSQQSEELDLLLHFISSRIY